MGLGGHGKTSFIATVDPDFCYLTETTSTLDFLKRARKIINNVEVNKVTSKRNMIKCLDAEIDKLRKDLLALRTGSGFYVDASNWSQMQREDVEKRNQIALMTEKILERENTLETLESGKDLKIEEWNRLNDNFRNLRLTALETKARMVKTEKSLQHEKNIAELYESTVEAISQQNQELLDLVSGSMQHLKALEERHKFLLAKTKENYTTAQEVFQDLQAKPNVVLESSAENVKRTQNIIHHCQTDINNLIKSLRKYCEESRRKTDGIKNKAEELKHITQSQNVVDLGEQKPPEFRAVHSHAKTLNSSHESLSNEVKSVDMTDVAVYGSKTDDFKLMGSVNIEILQMIDREKSFIRHLAALITNCMHFMDQDKTTENAIIDETAHNLLRYRDINLGKQENNKRLMRSMKEYLRREKMHCDDVLRKRNQFSDLHRMNEDCVLQVSIFINNSHKLKIFPFYIHRVKILLRKINLLHYNL